MVHNPSSQDLVRKTRVLQYENALYNIIFNIIETYNNNMRLAATGETAWCGATMMSKNTVQRQIASSDILPVKVYHRHRFRNKLLCRFNHLNISHNSFARIEVK